MIDTGAYCAGERAAIQFLDTNNDFTPSNPCSTDSSPELFASWEYGFWAKFYTIVESIVVAQDIGDILTEEVIS